MSYRTADNAATEVLRLNFRPARVTAGGSSLAERHDLKEEGYTIQPLASGDYAVRVRHAGSNDITVSGI